MFLLDNKPISITADLVIGEGAAAITIPVASLQSEATRIQYGITEVPDVIRADDRFYFDGNLETPRDLDDARGIIWRQQIEPHRDWLKFAGCPVGNNWYHNNLESRSQWERMVSKADKLGLADADPYMIAGQQVQWKVMGGAFVPLTAGSIREVVDAFELREGVIFAVAEQHKAALAEMNTVEEMLMYDWRAGWPAAFTDEQQ